MYHDGMCTRYYIASEAELQAKIDEYKDELKKVSNPSAVTFGEYKQQWFRTYKSHLAAQSQYRIDLELRKCASLDGYQVRRITKSMLQEIVNQSWEHPHAAKSTADVLRQIFQTAVSDGIIASNPAADLSRPKMKPAKFHLLTDEELEAVRKADLNEKDRLFVTILQVFGLRPGEALALQKRDFDLDERILHITKSLELPSDRGFRVKSTKTGITRDIPIPSGLVPYLRKSLSAVKSFFIFEKATGGPHTKTSYKRLSTRIWKAVNVELGGNDELDKTKDLKLYDFRHRRATDLYYLTQKGIISTKQAAALMGHSEIIFLKTYSHIDDTKENLDEIYPDLLVTNL